MLGLTLPYLMYDAIDPQNHPKQQRQQRLCPMVTMYPILCGSEVWARRAEARYADDPDFCILRRTPTPPYKSADATARLLLDQLVPQHPGNASIASQYYAFFAAGGTAAGAVLNTGAARARSAGRGRGFTSSSAGSSCGGLEVDRAGGGGARRTGGQ